MSTPLDLLSLEQTNNQCLAPKNDTFGDDALLISRGHRRLTSLIPATFDLLTVPHPTTITLEFSVDFRTHNATLCIAQSTGLGADVSATICAFYSTPTLDTRLGRKTTSFTLNDGPINARVIRSRTRGSAEWEVRITSYSAQPSSLSLAFGRHESLDHIFVIDTFEPLEQFILVSPLNGQMSIGRGVCLEVHRRQFGSLRIQDVGMNTLFIPCLGFKYTSVLFDSSSAHIHYVGERLVFIDTVSIFNRKAAYFWNPSENVDKHPELLTMPYGFNEEKEVAYVSIQAVVGSVDHKYLFMTYSVRLRDPVINTAENEVISNKQPEIRYFCARLEWLTHDDIAPTAVTDDPIRELGLPANPMPVTQNPSSASAVVAQETPISNQTAANAHAGSMTSFVATRATTDPVDKAHLQWTILQPNDDIFCTLYSQITID